MVGNYIVGIRQMSLLVVVYLLSRCHQGKNDNYGVSDSGCSRVIARVTLNNIVNSLSQPNTS